VTERLYYTAQDMASFDATVVDTGELDGRPYVVLDRTAFYPTSGGQPHDTGTLELPDAAARAALPEAVRVLEVVEREADGAILHIVERAVPRGTRVGGRIDWARRFDHMQQHTGQHILSAVFERVARARTVSFHLGSAASTIDLDREVPSPDIAAVEAEANRVVWENREVTVRFAEGAAALALGLRKEPARTGPLRVVEIAGCDRSACGGTHVARTGAVGVVAIASWERFKGGLRVEFLCGGRALAAYRRLNDAVARSVQVLSVLPPELPEAIARVQAEAKQLRKRIRDLTARVARHEAAALAARGARVGPVTLVAEALPDWDADGLRALAVAVAAVPGHMAILTTPASPARVAVARAADVPVDAAAIVKALLARFGGNGGGRADLAQGGGLEAEGAAILAAAREVVAAAVGQE
jgi:alanyl-tRNA synthetase